MSVEELTLAAEFKLKELDAAGRDRAAREGLWSGIPGSLEPTCCWVSASSTPGVSPPRLPHLEKVIERDPYCDTAYYYLAMDSVRSWRQAKAERNLFYIWPDSAYFGAREYHLGRLALLDRDYPRAIDHLTRAVSVNASDLLARFALALAYRESGDRKMALEQIRELETGRSDEPYGPS